MNRPYYVQIFAAFVLMVASASIAGVLVAELVVYGAMPILAPC